MLYQLSYFRIALCLCDVLHFALIVGRDGFEPPKVKTSRFTVCPIWPLWYLPGLIGKKKIGAFCRIRTNDLEITNHMLYQLS